MSSQNTRFHRIISAFLFLNISAKIYRNICFFWYVFMLSSFFIAYFSCGYAKYIVCHLGNCCPQKKLRCTAVAAKEEFHLIFNI